MGGVQSIAPACDGVVETEFSLATLDDAAVERAIHEYVHALALAGLASDAGAMDEDEDTTWWIVDCFERIDAGFGHCHGCLPIVEFTQQIIDASEFSNVQTLCHRHWRDWLDAYRDPIRACLNECGPPTAAFIPIRAAWRGDPMDPRNMTTRTVLVVFDTAACMQFVWDPILAIMDDSCIWYELVFLGFFKSDSESGVDLIADSPTHRTHIIPQDDPVRFVRPELAIVLMLCVCRRYGPAVHHHLQKIGAMFARIVNSAELAHGLERWAAGLRAADRVTALRGLLLPATHTYRCGWLRFGGSGAGALVPCSGRDSATCQRDGHPSPTNCPPSLTEAAFRELLAAQHARSSSPLPGEDDAEYLPHHLPPMPRVVRKLINVFSTDEEKSVVVVRYHAGSAPPIVTWGADNDDYAPLEWVVVLVSESAGHMTDVVLAKVLGNGVGIQPGSGAVVYFFAPPGADRIADVCRRWWDKETDTTLVLLHDHRVHGFCGPATVLGRFTDNVGDDDPFRTLVALGVRGGESTDWHLLTGLLLRAPQLQWCDIAFGHPIRPDDADPGDIINAVLEMVVPNLNALGREGASVRMHWDGGQPAPSAVVAIRNAARGWLVRFDFTYAGKPRPPQEVEIRKTLQEWNRKYTPKFA